MKMYVAGDWVGSSDETEIASPYSGAVIDSVPAASAEDVERALQAAVEGAEAMAKLTRWERSQVLNRAAGLMEASIEDFARTVSLEEGKPVAEARAEVSRCPELLRLSAFEGANM